MVVSLRIGSDLAQNSAQRNERNYRDGVSGWVWRESTSVRVVTRVS